MTESWVSLKEILDFYALAGFVSSKCLNQPAQLGLFVERLATIPCKKQNSKGADHTAQIRRLVCTFDVGIIRFSCVDAILYASMPSRMWLNTRVSQ